MNQKNGIMPDQVKEIMNKIDLYAETIKNDLGEININFEELKEYYKDDNSNKMYNKYEDFAKNYEVLYKRILNYNKVIDSIISNYEKTNREIINKITK